jgi:hypothetical protein
MAQRAIAMGCVAGATAAGAAFAYNRMSTCADRYPFILQGLLKASLPVEEMGFRKLAQMDRMNNVAHATVSMGSQTARITARRIVSPSSKPDSSDAPDTAYDDLDAEGSGLAFYWENPWEVKASLIRGFRAGLGIVKSCIPTMSLDSVEASEPDRWEIMSVSLDNEALIGDLNAHPFFASKNLKTEVVNEKSAQRTKCFLALLSGTALFLIGKRTYTNFKMWPGYVFARNYIQRHPFVTEFYGGETAEIITRTGSFGSEKIEAEITITGKKLITESVVKFAASRKDPNSPWMVSQALLVPQGCRPIDLLVAGR